MKQVLIVLGITVVLGTIGFFGTAKTTKSYQKRNEKKERVESVEYTLQDQLEVLNRIDRALANLEQRQRNAAIGGVIGSVLGLALGLGIVVWRHVPGSAA